MEVRDQQAAEWLADRALYYVENYSMLPKTALRLALRDLLSATAVAALRPAIQTALHEVLDSLPAGLRKVHRRGGVAATGPTPSAEDEIPQGSPTIRPDEGAFDGLG